VKYLTTLIVALMLTAHARADSNEELWYVVSLQGQPSGWAVAREKTADGKINSEMTIHLAVSRGQTPIEIEISTSFVETEDGKAIRATTIQQLAMMAKQTELVFHDDRIEMTTTQGSRPYRKTLPPIEGDWLTPAGAQRYVIKQIEAGEKQITYRTFDPSSSMKPIEVTVKVDGPTTVESFGKIVPATKVRTSMSLMPGIETVDYIDAKGRPLRTSVDAGMIKMDMVRADKKLALAQKAAPELLNATLIRPDKPIDKPRELAEATYVLRVDRGKLPDIVETPAQKFQRIDEQSGRVTVKAHTAKKVAADAPKVERSSIIDGQDPAIIKLKDKALAEAGDNPVDRAEAMRRFVHEYIDEKSLGVGLATASEVAQTRQGDCTEHAVLLAALLRADGIPSRTASGLIYVDAALGQRKIFGYHMWAQAWLDGRWVDLDGTLGADTPFDATHITLSTSTMDDAGWTNDLVDLAPLMGVLSIEVQQTK
jgi:transglutaminase-like putative cysteine protease